ncbi:MAG: hypothetical protein H7833_09400 [Magnetococcus sp. DMHC-1]|nr:hypothetical protein [Magnetococcales bacterium]
MIKSIKFLPVLAVTLAWNPVQAADVYTFTATTGGKTASVGLSDLSSTAKYSMDSLNIGYTEQSQATAVLNLRGVEANFAYTANSPSLQFNIPSLGITQTFNGATRKQSQDMLEDWFKKNPNILSRMFKEYAKSTPIDPIAGNPNSLMSQMAASDFRAATGIGVEDKDVSQKEDANKSDAKSDHANPGLLGVGIRYGQYKSNGFKTDTTTLPLFYSKVINKYTLFFDVPLSMIETESSKSYTGSLGVGLKVPVMNKWNITGFLRDGVGGSKDLGAVSGIYSGSLTSDFSYLIPDDGSKIMMGNMISYSKTYSIEVGGYETNYDLSNYIFRNGLAFERKLPFDLLSKKVTGELFAINTYFGGDDVYVKSSTDIGFDLGTNMTIGNYTYKDNKLGLTYTFGGGYTGFTLNYGYKF